MVRATLRHSGPAVLLRSSKKKYRIPSRTLQRALVGLGVLLYASFSYVQSRFLWRTLAVPEPPKNDPRLSHDNEDTLIQQQPLLNEQKSNQHLPSALQNVLQRAIEMKEHCDDLDLAPKRTDNNNVTGVDLPNFGIIDTLLNYQPTFPEAQQWNCQVPPEQECQETQFTVIFMGYRPDRVGKMKRQVFGMTQPDTRWSSLVKEVILVWNGERELKESEDGQRLASMGEDPNRAFRIFYPLKEGFPNDLMNRYHPRFQVKTKAILFYDDDGPFYSLPAITAGFELWKRNSNAEIGAMARRLDLSERQQAEYLQKPNDERQFVSQCRDKGDAVRYNFQYFAQFGARMVLPSGSFLHTNFLCVLWHPALEEIRRFVRAHPVHPDDATVSTIVSHVSGRSPKVYPRRINPRREGNETELQLKQRQQQRSLTNQQQRRRLEEWNELEDIHDYNTGDSFPRRRLLWDDGDHGEWAKKRASAINSLVSYFGSVNSGSLGWCYGTPYHDVTDDTCVPEMARFGMVPWLGPDHQVKACP